MEEERETIRQEYREKSRAYLAKYKARIAYLEKELRDSQESIHDKLMGQALSNPAIVKDGMSPTEAARTCCRYASAVMKARLLEE